MTRVIFQFFVSSDQKEKLRLKWKIDFRKLNEIAENETYGLTNLIDILDSLGSSKYFMTFSDWISSDRNIWDFKEHVYINH